MDEVALKTGWTAKRQRTQWAAQFLAAAELVRRGYTVSFTMGNDTPVADLMVGTPRGDQFWVDVKGQSAKNAWLLSPKVDHINLFYVLVLLAPLALPGKSGEPDRFFVLTQNEANKLQRDFRRDHPNSGGKMLGFYFKAAEKYEDKWDKLGRAIESERRA